MSVDEDNELRELVSQTLECNGILAKIRAELRASVFLALEEQDAFKDKPTFFNKALKEFISTSEGALVICLVREFLEFFGLEFTLAVFDPETQGGRDYEYIGRTRLANELKIKSAKKTPLLAQVVQTACSSKKNDDVDISRQTEHVLKQENGKTEEKPNAKVPFTGSSMSDILRSDGVGNVKNSSSVNGQTKQSSVTKDTTSLRQPLNDAKATSPLQSPVSQPNIGNWKPDSLKLDLSQSNSKPANSSLSSLGGLPPLAPLTNGQVVKPLLSQKDVSNDIKAILEQGLDSQENNYEEDFHSNASEKGTKKGQISASGSEIEEEISSVGDDQTSTSGAGDDGTVDTSISQESGHGDYIEDV